ncbi:MAG: hypothetical protein GWN02_07830 [Gemmatimonadetes bacterium]|nr:hypothetical protein [Actinomycetota bacterium]NIY08186.1 hypothetical protein [Gemmatimonadota bacterium]NIT97333.1 hypothetical protein [Actinomycetota bacterium]NIU69014.1 hypothetical protein [Actinomycetota bacterium]NIV89053.1 hypothetical protein [Actinomycetota bacterium]
MDILQLPSLPHVTPIQQAWSVLEAAERSALITRADDRPTLITGRDIAAGENRGLKTLADLEGVRVPSALDVPGLDVRAYSAEDGWWAPALDALDEPALRVHVERTGLGGPHREMEQDARLQDAINRILDGLGEDVALVGMAPGAAILMSRHEGGVRDLAGPPKACYCENPDYPHEYDDRRTGDPCDFDDYSVRCRR